MHTRWGKIYKNVKYVEWNVPNSTATTKIFPWQKSEIIGAQYVEYN